ncbi:rod shape-determining protein [Streptomyces sp. NBC_01310]|uniref:rod shape-determining protein n=1 Tax=Streptomyces sp. NBC_01310 TaxID=2903820 RepID=UPI0035B5E8E1
MGIALRTANTFVCARGRGIVLNEPSVVAVQAGTTTALAEYVENLDAPGGLPAPAKA